MAKISNCDESCKTEAYTVSISSPWEIYKFNIEIMALSELNIISPVFD